MNGEHRNISEILSEAMNERGASSEAVSNATDVPKRFIDSLIEGNFNNLPARPYVRGYLFKIAEALRIDQNQLWQSYNASTEPSTSGERDKLPSNRFAFRRMPTSRLIAILSVVIVLIFVGFRFNEILGRPGIEVDVPEFTSDETIVISGSVSPGDTLTLNGEVIYPNEEGYFEKRVQLDPGLNPMRFVVEKYLGQETVLEEGIFYQPKEAEPQQQEVEPEQSETQEQ
jgi:hypothetical protein